MASTKKAPIEKVSKPATKPTSVAQSSLEMPIQDFSKSFMYSVYQLQFLVAKRLEQVLLKEKTVSFSQFMILVGFECSDKGTVSQSDIAENLNLTEATVSRHVSVLVKSGLLVQTLDAKNRRKRIITMTTQGKAAFVKANRIVTRELASLFSVISPTDRTNIMKNFSLVLPQLLTKK